MSWKVKLALRWLALVWIGLLVVGVIAVAVYATIDDPWGVGLCFGIIVGFVWTVAAGMILVEWWDDKYL